MRRRSNNALSREADLDSGARGGRSAYHHPMIDRPSRPRSPDVRPVLSTGEAILLLLLVGLATTLALPHLRDTYAGAVVSGTCQPDCRMPDTPSMPQYS
jgi:hypothetical protein